MLLRFCFGLLLIGVLFSAAGCQSAEAPPAEPTPIQWQRVTFVASRLLPGFALNIPAEWSYVVGDSGIIVYNYPRILDLADDGAEMPEGSLVLNLAMLSTADVQRIGARNAAGIVDAFIGNAASDGAGPQYHNAEVIDSRGRDIAQSLVSIGETDSLLMALALNGDYLLTVIVAPRGELPAHSDMLNRIFSSVELRVAG